MTLSHQYNSITYTWQCHIDLSTAMLQSVQLYPSVMHENDFLRFWIIGLGKFECGNGHFVVLAHALRRPKISKPPV